MNRQLLGWALSFSIVWTLRRDLTLPISLMLNRWVLRCFNPLPQGPLVPGHAHTHPIAIFNVSSQDIFYCLYIKVKKNLGGGGLSLEKQVSRVYEVDEVYNYLIIFLFIIIQ